MKSSFARLAAVAACATASASLFAQTPAAPRRTAPATSATRRSATRPASSPASASGCATVPVLSPKIPALPAGVGCPKTLYTITSSATQLSPMVGPALRENLEKLNQTFSIAYLDLKVGTGALAAQKMYYTVNYTGYLTDGTKFDSSEGKDPITFPYGAHRVIQGWDSGFEGMHVGGKRRLYIPYQLAYGEPGRPPVIPAKAELIFDLELVSQSDKPPTPPAPPAPPASPDGAKTPGAAGSTGATGATGTSGATGTTGAAPAGAPGGTPGQPAKPATPPVTSTTPAAPASPTGSTGPKH